MEQNNKQFVTGYAYEDNGYCYDGGFSEGSYIYVIKQIITNKSTGKQKAVCEQFKVSRCDCDMYQGRRLVRGEWFIKNLGEITLNIGTLYNGVEFLFEGRKRSKDLVRANTKNCAATLDEIKGCRVFLERI